MPKFDPSVLKVTEGFDLAALDPGSTPGFTGDKDDAEEYLEDRGEVLSELQERLFAEGRSGGERAVLLVLQGLDTSGKGGIVRHVMGLVDPQGYDMPLRLEDEESAYASPDPKTGAITRV